MYSKARRIHTHACTHTHAHIKLESFLFKTFTFALIGGILSHSISRMKTKKVRTGNSNTYKERDMYK